MRFGPFEIVRPLGRGGMAETFLALWPGHEGFARQICLKRVLAERAAEPDFVLSFQREAKLAARLVHPHIAQVYDFGCEGETWWMALEHVPGGDLRALLKALGQPMPVDLGLVHRDVSPSNILLDLQGNFKLADFGIAKARHIDKDGNTAFSTTTGTIKGKAAYMAPEQALGLEVDGRADLWSFGVVMFEAFSGQKPFEGPTDLAMMMAASQGRRPRLVEVAPHVPSDVCDVVERLLTPNRDERFPSAGDVLEALASRPAPVQGRRRIAAMLQAIGKTAAALPERSVPSAEADPTTVEPAAAGVPPHEPIAPVVAPQPPIPALAAATVSSAERPRGSASSRAAPLAVGAVFLAVAVVSGLVVWRALGTQAGATTALPIASVAAVGAGTPVGPAVTVGAPPAPTIARGVLVPDEHELPSVTPGDDDEGPRAASRGAAERRAAPPSPPREPVSADRGSLHVTVIPWGDVTIDGHPHGRSPVTVQLPAGAHRVRIESESGAVTREVRITAGMREELEIDLSDG